jgi:MFS family permease
VASHDLKNLYEGLRTAEEREAAYDGFVHAKLKSNYAAQFLHGMFGMTGFRLINAPTFVPAYLHLLSGSDMIVGLGLALQQLGGVVSGVIGAAQIEHRPHVLRIAMVLGTLMRVQILGLALVGWFLTGHSLLIAVLFFLFMLGLISGPQNVVFQFLLAKVIPVEWRGRLQGLRNMMGGLVAAGLAYWAGHTLIQNNVWGNGYSATFLAAFVLTSIGLLVLGLLIREPEPPTLRPRMRMADRLRQFPVLLKGDPDFFYFMIARTFAVAGRVASPFYIIYVAHEIALTGKTIGLLTFGFLIASTVSNLVWGPLSDRFGFRISLVGALATWIVSTVLLMSVHLLLPIFIAFFGLGAAAAGYQISSQNIVLEFGHRDDMAMRLALSNAAESFMSTVGPLAGGIIAATLGYVTVFWTSNVFLIVALALLIFRVREPRGRAFS